MGAFVVNFHVRSSDPAATQSLLLGMGVARAWLTPPEGGWISICEEATSGQDPIVIRQFARRVSSELQTVVLACLVHDSDFFRYWLWDNGELMDQHHSWPDYWKAENEEETGQLRGNVETLLSYCRQGVRPEEVASLLKRPNDAEDADQSDEVPEIADWRLARLGGLFGIDRRRILADFRDLQATDPGEGSPWKFVGTEKPPAPRTRRKVPGPDLSNPQSALAVAACKGDVETVRRLVASGADVNLPDPFYKVPPIVTASRADSVAGVRALLDLGADVNGADGAALFGAVQAKDPELVGLLLRHGADPNAANRYVGTALHSAVKNNVVDLPCAKLLIDAGLDPNSLGPDGEGMLHDAVRNRSRTIIEFLIESGADVNLRNRTGQTPLDVVEDQIQSFENGLEQEKSGSENAAWIRKTLRKLEALAQRIAAAGGRRAEQSGA